MGLHRSVLSEWGSLEKSLLEVSNIVQQVPQSLSTPRSTLVLKFGYCPCFVTAEQYSYSIVFFRP